MDAAMSNPGDGLNLSAGQIVFLSDGEIIFFDLAAKNNADLGNIGQGYALAKPNTVGMAIDANVHLADDATEELGDLGAGQDLTNLQELSRPNQDLDGFGLVLAKGAALDLGGSICTASNISSDEIFCVDEITVPIVTG